VQALEEGLILFISAALTDKTISYCFKKLSEGPTAFLERVSRDRETSPPTPFYSLNRFQRLL